MCCNGIVGPDLTPHPGAWEVKKVQAPIGVTAASPADALSGRFTVWNKHLALDLSHFDIRWELAEDGAVIASGVLPPLALPAGEKALLQLPDPWSRVPGDKSPVPGAAYHLTVRFLLNHDTPWAAAGHEVAWEQWPVRPVVPVGVPAKPVRIPASDTMLTLIEADGEARVAGEGFDVQFCMTEGTILSYRSGGVELLAAGPRECYYRAPTDHDLLMGNPPANVHKWRAAGYDRLERRVISCTARRIDTHSAEVRVETHIVAPGCDAGILSEVTYRVLDDGEIVVSNTVLLDERLPFIPRIGLELMLPAGVERLIWFGRGPHENYCDRVHGAAVGRYVSTVSEQFTPYVFTQESGGKEDTRWLALTHDDGVGLMVIGLAPFHFDALHYAVADLAQAGHPHELTRLDETILHIDHRHMGVGGDDGWLSPVHPEFLIQPGRYNYAFRLRPITGERRPRRPGADEARRDAVASRAS